MSGMVERVALAIYGSVGTITGDEAIDAARAAIAAMREPTEAMDAAYTEAAHDDDGPAAAYLQTAAYAAMIDAALSEG